jgi:hypothetical protein
VNRRGDLRGPRRSPTPAPTGASTDRFDLCRSTPLRADEETNHSFSILDKALQLKRLGRGFGITGAIDEKDGVVSRRGSDLAAAIGGASAQQIYLDSEIRGTA